MARILKDFIKSSKDFDSQYDDYIEDKNHEIELNPQYQYYYDDNGNLFQVPRDNSDLVDEFGLDQPMDLSYPPSDQECESWMQFLRDLHEKRETERELERKEIYGDSEDKSFSTNRINSYTGSYYKNNERPLYISPNEGYEYFGKDTYVNNHPENYDNYVTRKQTSYDKHSKDYWDNPRKYSGPELNMDDSRKDMSEPEKYSEEWFDKNNINPYTSIPARMANKALEAENEAWRKHSSSNEDKVYKDYFGKDPYHYWDALEKFPKPKRYRGTWAGPGYTNNKYERDRILKGIREVKSNKHKIINDYDTKYPNGYHLGPENGGFTNTGKKEYESELKEWTNRLRDYKLSQRPYFKKLKRLENQYESNLNDPKFKEYKKNLLGDYPLEVGNRAIAEQYKLAEQKGLVNPDQNIYTGTRYMKLPDGFKEVDGAHDYIVLAKPIDDHTIKEIEYDNGKKHERIIRPNSDSYYNDWYFDENGKMKDWLKVQKDMSSGTFYVNTLRNPNLFYPVEYKKNPFRKVKAVYRADQPNIGYDYDKILNDETDEEYNKYLPIHNQAINDITQINLKGITEDELNLAINELAKKYPNKRFEINVKYKDMSMLNGLFR